MEKVDKILSAFKSFSSQNSFWLGISCVSIIYILLFSIWCLIKFGLFAGSICFLFFSNVFLMFQAVFKIKSLNINKRSENREDAVDKIKIELASNLKQLKEYIQNHRDQNDVVNRNFV